MLYRQQVWTHHFGGIPMIIKSSIWMLIILLCAIGLLSCSNGSPVDQSPTPPLVPDITNAETVPTASEGHSLWGYYLVSIDENDYSAEIIPVRATSSHWNIIQFLEQAPCTNCFKLAGITPNPDGTLNVNVSIKHPFTNLNLTGFDVRGIAMFNGSHVFPESGLIMSDRSLGEGEVVNADGYTTLYNPTTVGHGFEGYIKGKLATFTAPSSTLNVYKRFITDNPANTRNAFYAGDEIVVTYQIDMPDPPNPWVFGYAVDASWAPPISKPVDDPMTDFGPEANCPEPWKVETQIIPIGNGLNSQGGQIKLTVNISDYQGKTSYSPPLVECPQLFDGIKTASWFFDGPDFSSWEVIIGNVKKAPVGDYKCLIKIEDDENGGSPPYLDLTAYQIVPLEVSSPPGNLAWAISVGGVADDGGYGITSLSDDSTVVTGGFYGTATFGQGEPNEIMLFSTGNLNAEIFIARYNPDGTLAWAKSAGGTSSECGSAVTSLPDDSTVMAGYFEGSATFGQGEPNQVTLISAGSGDIFIAQYNSNGMLAWAKCAGGLGWDSGDEITTLSDNSTVVTGCFEASAIFGQGEPNETALISAGNYDIFIAQYNPDGSLAWAKRAGGADGEYGSGITSLSDNSTVVTGNFRGSATFGMGESNEVTLNSAGERDIFIIRYNPNGTLAWARRTGSISDDIDGAVTSLSDDSIVITGGIGSPSQWGSDILIARYGPDGSPGWVRTAGGMSAEWGSGITALADDSTVITGRFGVFDGGSAVFGEGEPTEVTLVSAGHRDIFVARYNLDGSLAWAKRAGGSDEDEGNAITALSNGSTVVSGRFVASAIFGQGEANQSLLTSTGLYDVFIARFEP